LTDDLPLHHAIAQFPVDVRPDIAIEMLDAMLVESTERRDARSLGQDPVQQDALEQQLGQFDRLWWRP